MNLPTKLTVLRVLMIPAFVAVYMIDSIPANRIIALAIFGVACFTDFLDGYIARKYNMITDLGKFLDPIADKLLVNGALLLLLLTTDQLLESIYIICAMIMIGRELIIGAFRLAAVTKNIVIAADIFGKIKTVVQMVALIVLIPLADITFATDIILWTGNSLLILATALSVLSLTLYIVKNRSVLKQGDN